MALLNLGHVTRTLLKLLEERLPRYPDWPSNTTLTVSAGPPDAVNGSHALSFYLHHLVEDAHTKSQDWPVDHAMPLRFRSMGLTLSYVLCPRSNAADPSERALIDQLVMGLALKTLHDYPIIDDTTTVETLTGPVLVMPTAIRGRKNRLRVLLRPTSAQDAAEYWQAGSLPNRLAAYYEVSATLLEPETVTTRRQRVLSVGVHSFVRGAPRLDATRSVVTYTPPDGTGPRTLEASPAELAYGQTLELLGADLRGDRTELLVVHPDFTEPVAVDGSWGLASDGSVLRVTVQPSAGAQALLPGIYGAVVRTSARRVLPDGSVRDFVHESNQASFALSPRIAASSFAADLCTLTLDRLDASALSGNDLMVFAGGERLTRTNALPTAGQMRPLAPDLIELRLPAGLPSGAFVPVRLIVRSAESGPTWVQVP
jgi:hypothetical protein